MVAPLLPRSALCLLLLSSLHAMPAAATTWWISVTFGSDGYSGTRHEPFRTITKAVSVAQPGDTIRVRGGTYDASTETFPLILKSGVQLIGTPDPHGTILDARRTARVIQCDVITQPARIEGFTIVGGKVTQAAGQPGGGGILCVSTGNLVTIARNDIVGTSSRESTPARASRRPTPPAADSKSAR